MISMAQAANRPCSKHPRILLKPGDICQECARERSHNWGDDRQRGNRHERGYGTAWEKRRKRILRRDNYLCQNHIRDKVMIPATEVDHIIPKARGGTDEDSNLQSLCQDCHKAKTISER